MQPVVKEAAARPAFQLFEGDVRYTLGLLMIAIKCLGDVVWTRRHECHPRDIQRRLHFVHAVRNPQRSICSYALPCRRTGCCVTVTSAAITGWDEVLGGVLKCTVRVDYHWLIIVVLPRNHVAIGWHDRRRQRRPRSCRHYVIQRHVHVISSRRHHRRCTMLHVVWCRRRERLENFVVDGRRDAGTWSQLLVFDADSAVVRPATTVGPL